MIFRESILECIFKAIGLTNMQNAIRKPDSVEQSPHLVTYDSRLQKAVFNNAFGFIDPYEGSGEGDTESIASTSAVSTGGTPSSNSLNNELRGDVEIVYFPKGSVLVEEGERNPGLYYVIDGFLDVSIPVDDKATNPSVLGSSKSSVDFTMEGSIPLKRTMSGSSMTSSIHIIDAKKKHDAKKSLFLIVPTIGKSAR